jgi:PAS domain S-box-containing protein
MKKKRNNAGKSDAMRLEAERRLEAMLTRLEGLPEENTLDIKRLVHELRVHQIELEMQNDELRNIQQELEASRKKYFDLYNFAPVGYFTFNKTGRILELNLQASLMFGRDRSSILNADFFSFIVNEDSDLFYWHLAKVCESRQRSHCEIRLQRNDGTQLYAHLESIVVSDDQGEFNQCRTAVSDISELKQAEAALWESEEKYRHLIENSNDAIYILYNNRFELINKKFEELFGVAQADLKKSEFNFIEFVAPKSRPFVRERMLLETWQQEAEPRYEFTALAKCGREFEAEVCVSFIKFNGGTATQGILRDVAERKRLEEQVRQAQKMEAIGKLAGGIAHDFNNLLTAILGNAELLRHEIGQHSAVLEEIMEIQKAGNRAALLTKQILAFARKQPLTLRVLNLNKIVNNLKMMLRRLIGENIELTTDLDPVLGCVKADLGQITQLLMNLVINAKEAIVESGHIRISTRNISLDSENNKQFPQAEPGRFILLAVEDTGTGIDAAIIEQIFEPFFTTKGLANSSGLGLSVVYGVVKQHGGWIYVNSEKEHGVQVQILLPVTDEIPVEPMEGNIALAELEGSGERILVVEDDEIVRDYVAKLLQSKSYRVTVAGTANEALRIFNQEKGGFDLVFSDVILPDFTGIKLAEMLAAFNQRLPVLLGSGYADHESEWPAIQEKGFHFIGKPYSIPHLLRLLREILGQQKA